MRLIPQSSGGHDLNRSVYILGVGQTKRGFFPRKDVRELIVEATYAALNDAGLDIADIEHVLAGHYASSVDGQLTMGQIVVDALGLSAKVACIHVEEACVTSAQAMHDGILAVASGMYDKVLVLGVTKFCDALSITSAFAESGYNPIDIHPGIMLGHSEVIPYIEKYHITDDDIYAWYKTLYWYASRDPISKVYGKLGLSKKQFAKLPFIHYPIRVGQYGHDYESEGASAVILSPEDVVRKQTDTRIRIAGMALLEESSYYPHMIDGTVDAAGIPQPEFATMHSLSVRNAWKYAFKMAKVDARDLDVFQPHDATLAISWSQLDSLGHPNIPLGHAPKWFTEGEAMPGGKLPCDTAGYCKAGYLPGSIALDENIENVHQLREDVKDKSRQCSMKQYVAATVTSPGRPFACITRRDR